MGIQIRPATPDDYTPVAVLYQHVADMHTNLPSLPEAESPLHDTGPSLTQSHYETLLTDPVRQLFVAVDDGKVIGVVGARCDDETDDRLGLTNIQARINCISVDPACRGRHVGQSLMTEVKNWARDRGASHLQLRCYEFNTASKAYETAGFERITHDPVTGQQLNCEPLAFEMAKPLNPACGLS